VDIGVSLFEVVAEDILMAKDASTGCVDAIFI
jgi:hypothetical protein